MDIKKKFTGDILFNIAASFIPIIILQLVAYPVLGRKLPEDTYGFMITMYSVIQLLGGTLGTGLNNVRLIRDKDYKTTGQNGDFNVLLIAYIIIIIFLLFFSTWYYQGEINFLDITLIILIGITLLINSYIEVEYRLNLKFNKILIERLITSLGQIIGLLLFFVVNSWETIFLLGQIACLVYNVIYTPQLKEGLKITRLFKKTFRDSIYIDISGFCTRAISYADKMFLLPLIGGSGVAIYYTATLIGKVILLGLNPINSVILSYISKKDSIDNYTFKLYLFVGGILCILGYIVCILVSEPILTVLFPQWIKESAKYIPITTLSVCILTYCNFITPFTMKFCDMKWQFIINAITLLSYVCFSLLLLKLYGLFGFCWGITISYIVKLIITLVIYIKKKNNISNNVINKEREEND